MSWNALFQPLPYFTAPTTPDSKLLTPLVYTLWVLISFALLPLAPLYLFGSLVCTVYISTQMGWRLKQTKPELVEDFKRRYLSTFSAKLRELEQDVKKSQDEDVVEVAPPAVVVEEVLPITQEPTLSVPEEGPHEDIQVPVSTVVEEPLPIEEESIVVEEPLPVVEEESIVGEEPQPIEEEFVVGEEPLPVVEEESIVHEESQPVEEESIVVEEPLPVVEEESVVVEEPLPVVEEESVVDEEPQPIMEEHKAEAPKVEQIDDQAPAIQQLVTATGPLIVAGLPLDVIEETLEALRAKAVSSYKMTESKSTTDSTTSDYSGSVCSDREEEEEELEEKREEIKEEFEEHKEEQNADVKVVTEVVDEPEEEGGVVSDNELTPQAPEYTHPAPAVEHEEEAEELAFTPTPPVDLPPAFGLCEKRGIREIADPRERHMHHAWIQQLVSAPVEESTTSSDDSHSCDGSDCDAPPSLSPVSSIGWAGVPESLGKLIELDLAAEKMEKIEEVEEVEKTNKVAEIEKDVVPSVAPPLALAPQTTEEAPVDKELSPEAPSAELISAASDPIPQETPVAEKELVPAVEITPMQGKDASENGSESGRTKEVHTQKRKKKAPVKRQANKKKYSKKSW